MTELLALAGRLIDLIVRWVQQGVTDAEILERLAAPGSVGRALIAAIRRREQKLDAYIARG